MDVICFHNPDEENGYLSNWYPSAFVVNDIRFTSMEQYMMFMKAILFGDTQIRSRVLCTDNVAKIKKYGRQVQGFNQEIWDFHKRGIIMSGLLEKFSQNPELKGMLCRTGSAVLAECAVKDTVWGIGLSMHDERRLHPEYWKGQNLLGECLMHTRSILQNY